MKNSKVSPSNASDAHTAAPTVRAKSFRHVLTILALGIVTIAYNAYAIDPISARIVLKPGDIVSNGSGESFSIYDISYLQHGVGTSGLITTPSVAVGAGLPPLGNETSDASNVAVAARLSGDGIGSLNDLALVSNVGGVLKLIAREHSPAPGLSNIRYSSFQSTAQGNSGSLTINFKVTPLGDVFFSAPLEASDGSAITNPSAVWVDNAGNILSTPELLVRTGMAAPGDSSVSIQSISDITYPERDPARTVTLSTQLSGSATTGQSIIGWDGVHHRLAMIARDGAVAPGIPQAGATMYQLKRIASDDGDVVVSAYLQGSGVPLQSNSALWFATPPHDSSNPNFDLSLIAQLGTQAPGMANGWVFSEIGALTQPGKAPKFAGPRTLVFSGRATDASGNIDYGIWIARLALNGTVTVNLIAKGSDPAPGLSTGIRLGLLNGPFLPRPVSSIYPADCSSPTNTDVVFASSLLGTGVSAGTQLALWHYHNGNLELLLRSGVDGMLGVPAGSTISSFDSIVSSSTRGQLIVTVQTQSEFATSKISYTIVDGVIRKILQLGDILTDYDGIQINTLVSGLINDLGQALLNVYVTPSTSRTPSIAYGPQGNLTWAITNNNVQIRGDDGNLYQCGAMTSDNRVINSGEVLFNCATGAGYTVVAAPVQPNAPRQCRADFNHDGRATLDDLLSFLAPWFVHNSAADFNSDGQVTNQDLFDFIGIWFQGC